MCALLGFGIQMISVLLHTYILKLAPKDSVGKIMTVVQMVSESSLPLSFCLSGILGEYFYIPNIFLVLGIFLFFGAGVVKKITANLEFVPLSQQ